VKPNIAYPANAVGVIFNLYFVVYFIMISSYVKAGDAVKRMIIKTKGCLE
jgi:hypothetical protein